MTEATAADLILTGGKIVTLDPQSQIAEAVAVAGDRIVSVGQDDDLIGLAADARRIDLGGRTVVPGLIDGHAHMDREGLKDRQPSLAGAQSIDDILNIIEAQVR
ncbi:MAG: amidohydrolase family protein, partial [Alphaproteobacteria bacterium]|nr:amidohydrolase family protein [Alphaproteobacteria bacterium]